MRQRATKSIILSLLVILSYSSISSAQTTGEKLYYGYDIFDKNVVHCSGAPNLFYFAGHFFYERMFFQREEFRSFIKIGYGTSIVVMADISHGPIIQLGFITRPDKHHFEMNLGSMYLIDDNFVPAISIGYRLQKWENNYIFRTGIGYPEGLYLGAGITF